MTASIEFKNDQDTSISALKIITLSDGSGNTYTLDAKEGGLKLKYQPYGQAEIEYEVNGLAAALRSLLDIKSGNYDDTGKEITVLAEKVAEKPIVEAILYAKDNDTRISDTVLAHTFARVDDVSSYINSKLETKADRDQLDKKADASKVYTKKEINNKLKTKANTCDVCTKEEIDNKLKIKADADNMYTKEDIDSRLDSKANAFEVYTKPEANMKFFPLAEHRALAQDILKKRIDGGSILVKTLGEFLDEEHAWYGNERNQTAKDFLAEKGKFITIDDSNVKIPDFTSKIPDAVGVTKDMQRSKRAQSLEDETNSVFDVTDQADELGEEILDMAKNVNDTEKPEVVILADENVTSVNAAGSDVAAVTGEVSKSVPVEKSGEFFDASEQLYSDSIEIIQDENFIENFVATIVSNPIFQEAVEEIVSQQFFEL
ncbi:hypothetical protein [Wolbachia endosymbiont (group B) of Pandemis corylana]|uniref:hypothetical protein n=1 Tax=Wolbachia endosymbiont (group B) of Pandemis corylana TaxID=2954039 RepID=UPI0022260C51|nr:hypothetical protein [Wolbachia endosymbiont (group B) of Pandemis corylana]